MLKKQVSANNFQQPIGMALYLENPSDEGEVSTHVSRLHNGWGPQMRHVSASTVACVV